jgi:hypothetical protein
MMKLKVGMAVEVEGIVSVITDIDTVSTIPDIYLIDGMGWYNDWQFAHLPNHFINNPGKKIMKARITPKRKDAKFYYFSIDGGLGDSDMTSLIYTTKAGARKAIKRWANKYGVNVEIVEAK